MFIGLQHSSCGGDPATTAFKVEITFYENVDWPWLKHAVKAEAGLVHRARRRARRTRRTALYNGAIDVCTPTAQTSIVPAGDGRRRRVASRTPSGKLHRARRPSAAPAAAQRRRTCSTTTASVFGAHDWSWRAESGDWRFFFLDVPKAPPAGTLFLANTTWDDAAPHTDIDTLIFGPR